MGTKRELARQIAELQQQHDTAPDDDDDDLEIAVERDGSKVTVKGRHARKVMRRLGLDEDDTPKDPGDDGDDDQGDDDPKKDPKKDPTPPAGHRYFK